MEAIYRTQAGARLIEAQYRDFLALWPDCSHLRVPTREGETFIIASGDLSGRIHGLHLDRIHR